MDTTYSLPCFHPHIHTSMAHIDMYKQQTLLLSHPPNLSKEWKFLYILFLTSHTPNTCFLFHMLVQFTNNFHMKLRSKLKKSPTLNQWMYLNYQIKTLGRISDLPFHSQWEIFTDESLHLLTLHPPLKKKKKKFYL